MPLLTVPTSFPPFSLEIHTRLFIHFYFRVINTSTLLNPMIIVSFGLLAFDMVTSSLWKSFLPLVSSTSYPRGSLSTSIGNSWSPGVVPDLILIFKIGGPWKLS